MSAIHAQIKLNYSTNAVATLFNIKFFFSYTAQNNLYDTIFMRARISLSVQNVLLNQTDDSKKKTVS